MAHEVPPMLPYRGPAPPSRARERNVVLVVSGSVALLVGLTLLVPIAFVLVMMVAHARADDSAGAMLILCCGVPGLLGLACIGVGLRLILHGSRRSRR